MVIQKEGEETGFFTKTMSSVCPHDQFRLQIEHSGEDFKKIGTRGSTPKVIKC